MAGFEKDMSSLEPITDLNELELHNKELKKTDHNQADQSQSQSQSQPKPKQQEQKKFYSINDDSWEMQQQGQKQKLPQRRKFANLANYEVNWHGNIDNSRAVYGHIDKRSSVWREEGGKAADLGGEGAELEAAMEGCDQRKKLLVQLAGNPVVGAQSKSQKSSSNKGFNNSSSEPANNPSRICRFCSREFPSGRALGGHMRVHGASLVADTTVHMEPEKQKQQQQQQHEELNLGSNLNHSNFNHARRRQIEEKEKASSFSSSFSSEMNSSAEGFDQHHQGIKHWIKLNPSIKLNGETDHEELEDEEEEANRMVNLSSFECTSGFALMGKTADELLGDGDGAVSSGFLTGKKNAALYKLRRNPKPNRRFIRDQELGLTNPNWPANYHANHMQSLSAGARRSLSPSPERARSCSECGKVFLSWKALFGHMRCHPEREWRGIQRPESSLELDRTARLITRRSTSAELSFADNNNCERVSDVQNREEIRQQEASFKMDLEEEGAFVVAAKKACSVTQKGGMASAMEPKSDSAKKTEQEEDRVQGLVPNKAQCIINSHKANRAAHIALLGEATDNWSPAWPTGKRSKRRRAAQSQHEPTLTSETTYNELRLNQKKAEVKDQEDLDMANCLVLLSSAGKNMQEVDRMCTEPTEESAFSHPGSKQRPLPERDYLKRTLGDGDEAKDHDHDHDDHDHDHGGDDDETENHVATLADYEAENHGGIAPSAATRLKYQCSTCKKCFKSHQALGGHRASHRKMKGCFAQMKNLQEEANESSEENITEDDFLSSEHIEWQMMRDGVADPLQQEGERAAVSLNPPFKPSKRKIRGHECSICHRIFPSGQALGGHKRCHWTGERIAADTASVASSNNNSSNKQPCLQERAEWGGRNSSTVQTKMGKEDVIDLNLPAPLDEEDEVGFDTTQGAPVYGTLLSNAEKGGQIVGSLIDYPGRRREMNSVLEDWTVKDLLGGTGESGSLLQATREIESRCRFDGRPPMWNQQWNNAVVTQIPQVCSMQPL